MSATLERWLAWERAFWSDLVQHDDGTPDAFEDLARQSEPHVKRMPWSPHWSSSSAFTPSREFDYGLPGDLVNEWESYARRWQRFLARNPRVRLADALVDISESHEGTSWPHGREDAIRAWVRSGFAGERPFHDGWRLDTPEWRQALAETARQAGNGWVYWDDAGSRLVWREG